MSKFRIAVGYDTYPSLFTPYQPQTPGLQYARRTPTGSSYKEEGPHIRFTFSILTEAQFQAMLTQAGVLSADTAEVTIYAQDENYEWNYFNGKAVKPALEGRRGYFLYGVPLLIRGLYVATVEEPEP